MPHSSIKAPLDPGYPPAVLFIRPYAPLVLGLERGTVLSRGLKPSSSHFGGLKAIGDMIRKS